MLVMKRERKGIRLWIIRFSIVTMGLYEFAIFALA